MLASPTDLNYFLEVAHAGSLSHAAQRLGITQPTLSQSIKRLEDSLGIQIFNRHKAGVTLTPGGRHLQTHARILLEQWNQLKKQLNASHQDMTGSFTIGAHSEVALYSLPQTLPKIMADNPGIEIKLEHGLSRHITAEVINMRIDIGIVINPVRHPELLMKKVRDDVVGFWASAEHANALSDIDSGEAVLLCDPELLQTQALLQKVKSKKKILRQLTSSNMELLAEIANRGGGICLLPESVVNRNFQGKLKLIKTLPTFEDELFVICRIENRQIKALQTIFEAIVKGL